jgi:hypothetical protein
MRRLFLILAAGLLLAIPAVMAATAANAATPEIWFSPRSGADNAVPSLADPPRIRAIASKSLPRRRKRVAMNLTHGLVRPLQCKE